MQTNKVHWAALITLIVIGIGVFFLLSLSIALALVSFVELAGGEGDPAAEMISAFSFGFLLLVLLVSGWFVLGKARGMPSADEPFAFQLPAWMRAVIPALVILVIVGGGLVTLLEAPWLNLIILPTATLLVIVAPIWLLFGVAANRIELGPRWRFFTILSLGITIGPFLMIVIEIILILIIAAIGVVYVSVAEPEIMRELRTLVDMLNTTTDESALISILTPYITNPTVIAIGLGYVAVIVPLIEELLKPLAVWFFARQISSPAQGFALGVLSGAAFALLESLNASSDGSGTWAVIVTARTGTSLLHMLTSGLVGWGITSTFAKRRIGKFFAAYFSAFLIHGIWNAAAGGIGIAALGESVGRPEWVFHYAPAFLGGLIVLAIGVTVILFAANRELRAPNFLAQAAEEKVESTA
ncbi:MAG: PrsW family intramembrane metalloprotease [Chloroflexi bacterium]|nr:PrsW family intramembrane metalloprotease [Chloroflexota bacterium]